MSIIIYPDSQIYFSEQKTVRLFKVGERQVHKLAVELQL